MSIHFGGAHFILKIQTCLFAYGRNKHKDYFISFKELDY